MATRDSEIVDSNANGDASAAAAEASDEEYEDVYVTLDLGPKAKQQLGPDDTIEWDSLAEDKPLFRIGKTYYEGQWAQMVGTEAFVDSQGEIIGLSRDKIHLAPVTLIEKKERKGKLKKEVCAPTPTPTPGTSA